MDAEGWVLAGGQSLRMGRDKARVTLAGRPLLEHMLRKLQAVGLRTSVAGVREPLEEVSVLADRHPDTHPGCGPLSGIETALSKSGSAAVLVVGVDLPLLETEFLTWMVRRAGATGAMATIPRLLGEPQPLCAVYRRELLGGVTKALEDGDYKVMVALEGASGGEVDSFEMERVAAAGAWRSGRPTHCQFMNCNTPEDLALAEAMAVRTPIL
jgi:molybdenum cofactor guanylyltransferase